MAVNFDEELTGGRRVSGKDDIAIRAVGYILIGLFALICVIPFYLIIVASFTDEASLIRNGYPLIPTDFSVEDSALSLKNPTSILAYDTVTIGVNSLEHYWRFSCNHDWICSFKKRLPVEK